MKPLLAVFLAVLLGASVAPRPTPDVASDASPSVEQPNRLDSLQTRIDRLEARLTRDEDVYLRELAPVRDMMLSAGADSALALRIAMSLVAEARKVETAPGLLASVLLVENPWLDPDRRSSVGAVGLMQVMPFHAGNWGCASADLENVEANICHGAQIFANAMERSRGNLDRALLRYNGCVRGTNTPNCFEYPERVYAKAGRAQLASWLDV